jgi:hypothetical protein
VLVQIFNEVRKITVPLGTEDILPRGRLAEAERCRRKAAEAISPLDKEAWLQLAAEWLSLASIHARYGSPAESEELDRTDVLD